MKKLKITYGVNGMIEFQAVFKVGKSKLKIQFSEGSFNASSKKPATYTTDNLMVQHAIENSAEYKRGLIHKVSTVELNEEVKVLRNGSKVQNVPVPIEIKAEGRQIHGSEKVSPANGESVNGISEREQENGIAEETTVEESKESASETQLTANELKEVEVTCNDDAKDYLEENFGVNRSKLRNRDTILSVGRCNGVEFVFV